MRLITGLSKHDAVRSPIARISGHCTPATDRAKHHLPINARAVGTACVIAVAVCGLCGIGRVEFPHPSAADAAESCDKFHGGAAASLSALPDVSTGTRIVRSR
jgi:hypothetical protein